MAPNILKPLITGRSVFGFMTYRFYHLGENPSAHGMGGPGGSQDNLETETSLVHGTNRTRIILKSYL